MINAGNATNTPPKRDAPAANANGSDTFAFTVTDNGTTNGAAAPLSLSQSLTITVTPVNDVPVRTAGTVSDLTVAEDSATTSLGLSTLAYSPGPANEAGQTLTYQVTALPAASLGQVLLTDGVTVVTANTSYTLAQIQGMKFRPAANASGSGGSAAANRGGLRSVRPGHRAADAAAAGIPLGRSRHRIRAAEGARRAGPWRVAD